MFVPPKILSSTNTEGHIPCWVMVSLKFLSDGFLFIFLLQYIFACLRIALPTRNSEAWRGLTWLDRIAELIQLILSLGRGQWGAPHVLTVHEGACELLVSLNQEVENVGTCWNQIGTLSSIRHTSAYLLEDETRDFSPGITIGLSGHEPALGWRSTEADRGCGL